jgi:hypothetical protein
MTEAWRFNREFAYSSGHKTWAAAREAQDDCFATGEVCESEFAGIRRRTTANGFRYDVMIFV